MGVQVKTDDLFLMTFFKEIKTSIFKVFYLILKDQEQKLSQTIFLSIVQLLQLLYLPFALKVNYVWKYSQITAVINNLLSYFEILLPIKDKGFSIFLYLFYSFAGLIVLMMLGLALLVNQQNRKNQTNWVVLVVRIGIKLMITILFFPVNQIFFGLLSCQKNDQGVNVLVYESDVVCWSSEHTVHGVFSIIIILIFQLQINTFTLFLFEAKKSNTDTFAQRSGRQFSLFHIYITLSSMVYQLLETPTYTILIIWTMFILSFHFYYQIKYSKPFYNLVVQKLWNMITAVNCWTILMLNFAYMLEGSFFSDTLLGYGLGIPLIIIVIFKEKEEEIDLLFANLNNAVIPADVIKQCEFLLNLNSKSQTDQHSQLLIDAFLEIHEQTCPRLDCILKNKQLLRQIQNKFSNRLIENQIILNELIIQILTQSIKLQPLNVDLRLYYSFFLIDEVKQPQLAFIELSQAENNSIPIDQQFILFRYKRIIEDIQLENDNNKLEANNFINNQNILMSLNQKLETQCILQLEFLTALEEEKPDLAKIDTIGLRVLKIKKMIEKEWQKVQQQNSFTSPYLYKIMSKYFFFVQNDELEGNLALIKEEKYMKLQINDLMDLDQIAMEPQPIIILNTDSSNLGIIKDVNIASCSFLGFSKSDLVERKLSVIQPQLYCNFHDELIDNYLKRITDIQKSKVEKTIFIKNKQGYIQQCQLQIKQLMSQNQEIFLVGKLGIELIFKPICYIMCSTDGVIKEINSACVKILRLDIQMIKQSNRNIKDLFPDILNRIPEFQGKKNIISFNFQTQQLLNPQRSSSLKSSLLESSQFDDQIIDDAVKLYCSISEIIIDLPSAGFLGYIFRFEKIPSNKLSINANTTKLQIDSFYKFNFKFNRQQTIYTGSYQNYMQTLHKISYDTSSIQSVSQDNMHRPANRKITKKSTSIGNGIRTVRLVQGQLIDVEQSSDEEESDNEQNDVDFLNSETKDSEISIQQDYLFLKSKSSFTTMIKKSLLPQFLTTVRFIISVLILCLLLLGYLQFFFDLHYQDEIQRGLNLFLLSNQRLAKILILQSTIQELKLMNLNKSYLTSNYTLEEIKHINTQTLIQLYELHSTLSQASLTLSNSYKSYQQEYENSEVEMTQDNQVVNYTFNEAIEQVLVKAYSLTQQDYQELTDENVDLKYFEQNTYNSIVYHNYVAQYYFYYYMITVLENKSQNVQIILILVTLVLFIIYVTCSILILKIKHLRDQILVQFLLVSEITVKHLKKNYEYFLQFIQSKEDEENIEYEEELRKLTSDIEDGVFDSLKTNENDMESQLIVKKKRKRFENSHTILRNILISIIFIILIFQVYFIFLIIDNNNLDEKYNQILPVLNITSISEAYFRYADNSFKQKELNSSFQIYFGYFNTADYIQIMLRLNTDLYKLHTDNQDILDLNYISTFEQIFIINPCDLIVSIDDTISSKECNSFNDAVIGKGLSLTLIKYIKYLDQSQKNKVFFQNIRKTQMTYFTDCFLYLENQLVETISNDFSVIKLTRVSLFAVFNLLMVIVYFFIWIPLVGRLVSSIFKTRLLLTLIPNSEILKIKTLMQYLLSIRNPV